jgi:hypothetical protein
MNSESMLVRIHAEILTITISSISRLLCDLVVAFCMSLCIFLSDQGRPGARLIDHIPPSIRLLFSAPFEVLLLKEFIPLRHFLAFSSACAGYGGDREYYKHFNMTYFLFNFWGLLSNLEGYREGRDKISKHK